MFSASAASSTPGARRGDASWPVVRYSAPSCVVLQSRPAYFAPELPSLVFIDILVSREHVARSGLRLRAPPAPRPAPFTPADDRRAPGKGDLKRKTPRAYHAIKVKNPTEFLLQVIHALRATAPVARLHGACLRALAPFLIHIRLFRERGARGAQVTELPIVPKSI